MAAEDTTVYSPRIFVANLGTAKRLVAGDQATGTQIKDRRVLAGDQTGVRLLAGDQA